MPSETVEKGAKRWLWRYPHRLVWRSLVWWRYVGEPPWRQQLTGLIFINPRPLDPALKAGLMTKVPPR